MSRVEEALRRAMDGAASTTTAVPEPDDQDALNRPEALASEPFPLELPERRSRPVSAPRPVPPAPLAAVPDAAAPTAAGDPETRPQRLLEHMDGGLAQKVVIDHKTMPLSREQYRRLAATLHQAQAATGLKVVMIGSAVPGEGKTLTAANLALTFSESYRRTVLLIDADLRRPSQHHVFKLEHTAGLSEGLGAVTERPLRVQQISPTLSLLPAGRPTSDPMAGLTSPRMQRLIAEAREMFDWVIVDTPPVGLLPDANLLGSFVDGAVMVVRAGSTSHDIVKRAVEAIGRSRLLGIVLNRAERQSAMSHYDYYDAYYGVKDREVAPAS